MPPIVTAQAKAPLPQAESYPASPSNGVAHSEGVAALTLFADVLEPERFSVEKLKPFASEKVFKKIVAGMLEKGMHQFGQEMADFSYFKQAIQAVCSGAPGPGQDAQLGKLDSAREKWLQILKPMMGEWSGSVENGQNLSQFKDRLVSVSLNTVDSSASLAPSLEEYQLMGTWLEVARSESTELKGKLDYQRERNEELLAEHSETLKSNKNLSKENKSLRATVDKLQAKIVGLEQNPTTEADRIRGLQNALDRMAKENAELKLHSSTSENSISENAELSVDLDLEEEQESSEPSMNGDGSSVPKTVNISEKELADLRHQVTILNRLANGKEERADQLAQELEIAHEKLAALRAGKPVALGSMELALRQQRRVMDERVTDLSDFGDMLASD